VMQRFDGPVAADVVGEMVGVGPQAAVRSVTA
jgi:hypothetical protein